LLPRIVQGFKLLTSEVTLLQMLPRPIDNFRNDLTRSVVIDFKEKFVTVCDVVLPSKMFERNEVIFIWESALSVWLVKNNLSHFFALVDARTQQLTY
jgi:hypothetical protein